jgi:Flp pilus assembly protein TadG
MVGKPSGMARRGTVTVEFALVAPVLMLLLAAVLNGALVLRTAVCAANAARAGAQYGSRSAVASLDTAGMQAAALNSLPGLTLMTATATRNCKCPDGTAVSCGGSCVGGKMLIYVQVNTQASAYTVFDYSGLSLSKLVASQAVMRVQ